MPTVLRVDGYRFFFFSLEGTEPPHIHVEKAERYAKAWLTPVVLAKSRGFRTDEISDTLWLVRKHRAEFLERWHESFNTSS